MVGNQDAQAAVFEPAHDLLDFVHRNRVNAAERLIEQQQFGAGHQSAGDFQPAFFSAAQRVGFAGRQRSEVQLFEQVFEPGFALGPVHLAGFEDGQNILLHIQLAENRGFLRQIADAEARPLVHWQPGDILVQELDGPPIGPHHAHDHVERGGLARAVGAQQTDDLVGVDLDGDAIDDPALAILLHEVLRAKEEVRFHPDLLFGLGGLHTNFCLQIAHFGRGGMVLKNWFRGESWPPLSVPSVSLWFNS